MKKNILFIANSLVCGGSEKSLISLLETIDQSKYNIDLFLFRHKGMFFNRIPGYVHLLPAPRNYDYLDYPIKKSVKELLKKRDFKLVASRGILGVLAKTEKNGAVIEQKFWKYLASSLKGLDKEYDVAIGYQEKNPIYFLIDKVKAKKKIGWIHTDYNKLNIDFRQENNYFKNLDYLVTVSQDLLNILKEVTPENHEKIKCIENIISPGLINLLSSESVDNFDKGNCLVLLSVGRLAKEKGLDISLEAIKILVDKGYNIKWYLIGEGDQKIHLQKALKEKNLESRVVFLGQKVNPYPYIRKSDIYIQTSRYEGKSISIEEAKVLAKPIVVTNFSTASNQVTHGETGLIAEMDAASVAEQIELLINDKELLEKLIANLGVGNIGNEYEVNKLYDLIEV
ncbi:glycosyltransferase [Robertmurraya sp. GLU-23]